MFVYIEKTCLKRDSYLSVNNKVENFSTYELACRYAICLYQMRMIHNNEDHNVVQNKFESNYQYHCGDFIYYGEVKEVVVKTSLDVINFETEIENKMN